MIFQSIWSRCKSSPSCCCALGCDDFPTPTGSSTTTNDDPARERKNVMRTFSLSFGVRNLLVRSFFISKQSIFFCVVQKKTHIPHTIPSDNVDSAHSAHVSWFLYVRRGTSKSGGIGDTRHSEKSQRRHRGGGKKSSGDTRAMTYFGGKISFVSSKRRRRRRCRQWNETRHWRQEDWCRSPSGGGGG